MKTTHYQVRTWSITVNCFPDSSQSQPVVPTAQCSPAVCTTSSPSVAGGLSGSSPLPSLKSGTALSFSELEFALLCQPWREGSLGAGLSGSGQRKNGGCLQSRWLSKQKRASDSFSFIDVCLAVTPTDPAWQVWITVGIVGNHS